MAIKDTSNEFNHNNSINKSINDREILKNISYQAMIDKQFLPTFSREILEELNKLSNSQALEVENIKDLCDHIWCSIDNDDSEDLDQLTLAKQLENEEFKLFIAIADVDALVLKGSAIDAHAKNNTTSIYTAAEVYPMLPEKLSTNLTSLNFGERRLALVIELHLNKLGQILNADIYRAVVKNYAKLTYKKVAAWLEKGEQIPVEVSSVSGLTENILLQDKVAQILRKNRSEHGALELETIEGRPVFENNKMQTLEAEQSSRSKQLIEDCMIAANSVTTSFLRKHGLPSFRRIVRMPKRWERIVQIAAQHGTNLPVEPDSIALAKFLAKEKQANPIKFPDLSLTIIKLLGKGEYVVELPGEESIGHFGLAVKDYTHSTAPNRRYPDLITHRILKAAINNLTSPYPKEELIELARHCTEREDAAEKVERQVAKSSAALLLSTKIGEVFEGICTGAAEKGTWVRIFHPPVEGKLLRGFEQIDVGHRMRVKLISTDIERGFINFALESFIE